MSLPKSTFSFTYGPLPKRVLYAASLFFLVAMFSFCVFYLATGYDGLRNWFFSLNDCFYQADRWTTDFFTPAVKLKGNRLALMGCGTSVAGAMYILYSWRRHGGRQERTIYSIALVAWGWYAAVVAIALVAGVCSWRLVAPAYDEVFSAVNCVALHPLQTISYYMLPNNHMYFNLVNKVLFGWHHEAVDSGRLISLLAYTALLLCAYHWLWRLMGNRWHALLALLPVALQFMVWGMAAQARGYEVQLLCAWLSFATMLRYLRTQDSRLLLANAICCIAGFTMVSTYLHYYVAQTIVVLCALLTNKQKPWQFCKYQLFVIFGVFLLYLPAFCFSGVAAFTANRYVTPAFADVASFLPEFGSKLHYFIGCCFSMVGSEAPMLSIALFLLPLSLLLFNNRRDRLIAFFYIVLWMVFSLITLNMRRTPFTRNLAMHFSLTMAIVVYTFYRLVQVLAARLPKMRIAIMSCLFVLPIVAYSLFLAVTDKRDMPFMLYYNYANTLHEEHVKELSRIPNTASIGFSQECFYGYYLFSKQNPNAHKCATGQEDYYVKRREEPLPAGQEHNYVRQQDGYEDFEYYKRK